ILFLSLFSCGKKEDSSKPKENSNNPLKIERAFFTNPALVKDKSGDVSVMNNLIVYFNRAPKGSIIHVNVYQFTSPSVLKAVEKAYNRGVIIKILLDNEHGFNT